jgi:hypothetical protein
MFQPDITASMCLLWKQEIEAGEELGRWQTSSIVIDSKLRLEGGIHNDIANLKDFAKADTQWDQVFVGSNIEAPYAAGPKVVPASDAQSGDWLKCHSLCIGVRMLACKRVPPSQERQSAHSLQ